MKNDHSVPLWIKKSVYVLTVFFKDENIPSEEYFVEEYDEILPMKRKIRSEYDSDDIEFIEVSDAPEIREFINPEYGRRDT